MREHHHRCPLQRRQRLPPSSRRKHLLLRKVPAPVHHQDVQIPCDRPVLERIIQDKHVRMEQRQCHTCRLAAPFTHDHRHIGKRPGKLHRLIATLRRIREQPDTIRHHPDAVSTGGHILC